jgi:hypothetical protein
MKPLASPRRKILAFIAVWLVLCGFTVELSWDDNSNNEDGFVVEHRGPKGGWKELARVGRDVTRARVTIEDQIGRSSPRRDCFRVVTFVLPTAFAKPSNHRCQTTNQPE